MPNSGLNCEVSANLV